MRDKRYKAKSVGKERHLYSMKRQTGAEPDVAIERDFLGPQVDDPAARVHAQILARGVTSLEPEQMAVWSRFIISMMLRVPRSIETIRTRGREVLAAQLREAPEDYLRTRGNAPEATLMDWVANRAPEEFDDLGVRTLPSLVYSEKLNQAILRLRWESVSLVGCKRDLLISDRPLTLVGSKLDSEGVFLALPLSPTWLFYGFRDPQIGEGVRRLPPAELIREANVSACRGADRYVFATDDSQRTFVAKYLQARAWPAASQCSGMGACAETPRAAPAIGQPHPRVTAAQRARATPAGRGRRDSRACQRGQDLGQRPGRSRIGVAMRRPEARQRIA